jgi:hypothetical protein
MFGKCLAVLPTPQERPRNAMDPVRWPNLQDFSDAVQAPSSCFTDPDLAAAEAVATPLGLPKVCSGAFAVVFQMRSADGKRQWAAKCFTRAVPDRELRYREISRHLVDADLPFAVSFRYLEQGIKIRGSWYPIVKMDWVEGLSLTSFVRESLQRPARLKLLGQMWLRLSQRMAESQVTHGDLQHGNVLLVPGSTENKLALKLVDYDGMYVPALKGKAAVELGLADYQHPLRVKTHAFGPEVDRFSHLLIYTAIRTLEIHGEPLWNRFDTGENMLFASKDFADPGKSPLFAELSSGSSAELRTLSARLVLASVDPLAAVPELSDLVVDDVPKELTAAEQNRFATVMNAGKTVAVPSVARPAPSYGFPQVVTKPTFDPASPAAPISKPVLMAMPVQPARPAALAAPAAPSLTRIAADFEVAEAKLPQPTSRNLLLIVSGASAAALVLLLAAVAFLARSDSAPVTHAAPKVATDPVHAAVAKSTGLIEGKFTDGIYVWHHPKAPASQDILLPLAAGRTYLIEEMSERGSFSFSVTDPKKGDVVTAKSTAGKSGAHRARLLFQSSADARIRISARLSEAGGVFAINAQDVTDQIVRPVDGFAEADFALVEKDLANLPADKRHRIVPLVLNAGKSYNVAIVADHAFPALQLLTAASTPIEAPSYTGDGGRTAWVHIDSAQAAPYCLVVSFAPAAGNDRYRLFVRERSGTPADRADLTKTSSFRQTFVLDAAMTSEALSKPNKSFDLKVPAGKAYQVTVSFDEACEVRLEDSIGRNVPANIRPSAPNFLAPEVFRIPANATDASYRLTVIRTPLERARVTLTIEEPLPQVAMPNLPNPPMPIMPKNPAPTPAMPGGPTAIAVDENYANQTLSDFKERTYAVRLVAGATYTIEVAGDFGPTLRLTYANGIALAAKSKDVTADGINFTRSGTYIQFTARTTAEYRVHVGGRGARPADFDLKVRTVSMP